MGLREYVNDLNFSKRVNYSGLGRKFENGDFARCVELSINTAKFAWNLDNEWEEGKLKHYGKITALPVSVLAFSIVYPITKFRNHKSASYIKFSNDPDLILNH